MKSRRLCWQQVQCFPLQPYNLNLTEKRLHSSCIHCRCDIPEEAPKTFTPVCVQSMTKLCLVLVSSHLVFYQTCNVTAREYIRNK